jgi:GT2 family glycosyltransferase
MMLRRDVLDSVGLFDEAFFLFYEEMDLCLRAHRAGWTTWYVHESHVRHAGAVSTGLRENGRRVPPYWYASRIHYFLKNHGRRHLWGANALFALGYAAWRVRRRLQRKPDVDPPHLLVDFLRYNLLPTRRSGTR